MLSDEIKKQIFLSIPISFTIKDTVFQAYKEYAYLANASEHLKNYPNDIYIVIDFADDEIYQSETPINYLLGQKMNVNGNIENQIGTRNTCALNLHIYTTWNPKYRNSPFDMSVITNTMQFWALRKLEQYVDYIQLKSIQPITETDDRILHVVVPCTFVYTNSIIETIKPIKTITYMVNDK